MVLVDVLEVNVKTEEIKRIAKNIVLPTLAPIPKTDKENLIELLKDVDVKTAVKDAVK